MLVSVQYASHPLQFVPVCGVGGSFACGCPGFLWPQHAPVCVVLAVDFVMSVQCASHPQQFAPLCGVAGSFVCVCPVCLSSPTIHPRVCGVCGSLFVSPSVPPQPTVHPSVCGVGGGFVCVCPGYLPWPQFSSACVVLAVVLLCLSSVFPLPHSSPQFVLYWR